MAAAKDGANFVHDDVNWRERVKSETKCASDYEDTWGFMKMQMEKKKKKKKKKWDEKQLDISIPARPTPLPPPTPEEDFEKSFVKTLQTTRRTPLEKYTYPQTTTHQYGWGSSLERFGVADYGRRKLPNDIQSAKLGQV